MIFIPYEVDVPHNHRPVVNWIIVAAVIGAFVLQVSIILEDLDSGIDGEDVLSKGRLAPYVLDGWGPPGILGHMWLHLGVIHLVGNVLFLWIFGNAVCSKVGNIWYGPLYLGFGIAAAVAYLIFSDGTALGASGAINGVVGMYLVFFPENSVSCMLIFYFRPVFFSVRGFWLILLFFAFDIWGAASGGGVVAYMAHIGGFAAGFGLAILMLKLKWITMERDEKSLLMFLGFEKTAYEKMDQSMERRDFEPWQRRWSSENPVEAPQQWVVAPAPMIRFICGCGFPVKIAGKYAGRVGRCPQCNRRIQIPGSPDA